MKMPEARQALSYMASRPGYFLRNYALKAVNFVRFPGAEPPGADAPPVPFREPYGLTGLVTGAGLLGCVLLPVLRRRDAAVRATVLLVLYLVLILRALDPARKAKDEFGSSLALGIAFMFTIYFVVNIGMTIGIMPVVGIPLPFMSYGGTGTPCEFHSDRSADQHQDAPL